MFDKVIVHGLPCVPRPSGEQLLGKLIPKPFVDQPNDAVHIKIRLAVRLHGQKLRFKFVVPAGSPHLIDGPPLARPTCCQH